MKVYNLKNSKVSIVILNYNGKDKISKCLDSCFKLNIQKKNLEVIVVDNNSSDGSVDFIKKKFPKLRVIKNKENIGTAGFNSAINKAKGDFLFFLNDDDVLTPNCLFYLIGAMNISPNVGVCGPKGLNYYDKTRVVVGGSWVSRSFYCGSIKTIKKPEKIIEVPYAGAPFLRRSVLKELGYIFDPDYFLYGEDIDLGLRVRLIGKKTLYVPSALIYHVDSSKARKKSSLSYIIFLTERNLLTTFFKISGNLRLLLYAPYVFTMRCSVILRDFIFLRPLHSFARIKAIFWIFTNFSKVMNKRKETQKIRKAKDRFIFKVFSEKKLLGF